MKKLARWRYVFVAAMLAFAGEGYASSINAVLAQSGLKVDIGKAALVFAKEIFPEIDIDKYSADIDRMASQVHRLNAGREDPEMRVSALNTVLYRRERIAYDHSKDAHIRRENRFLNGILETRKGTCVTMPMLYLAVAQRLGYPIYPVAAPDHLFLRYVLPNGNYYNIEATGEGGQSPDEAYIKEFGVKARALQMGGYMRTMTHREFLADMLLENATELSRQAKYDKAIEYLERAIIINPKFPDYYYALGTLYSTKGRNSTPSEAGRYETKARYLIRKSQEMGFQLNSLSDYQRRVQK